MKRNIFYKTKYVLTKQTKNLNFNNKTIQRVQQRKIIVKVKLEKF